MIEFLIQLQAKQEQFYKILKKAFILLVVCLMAWVAVLEISDATESDRGRYYDGADYAVNYDQAMAYQDAVKALETTDQNTAFIALVESSLQDDLEINDGEMTAIDQAYKDLNVSGNTVVTSEQATKVNEGG